MLLRWRKLLIRIRGRLLRKRNERCELTWRDEDRAIEILQADAAAEVEAADKDSQKVAKKRNKRRR